jgi:crotonobetainyl-CoA:carnitine CoA-transferase CaiB-like acyl-CoA transferase
MAGPLSGLTIVELAGIGPGPMCSMMLGDMGADVIRVDRTRSHVMDRLADPKFAVHNRSRRSVSVDLQKPEGIEVVLRLVDKAHGMTEPFRPGVAERLGVGPDACLARNPRLVYGRMTGWGQEGRSPRLPVTTSTTSRSLARCMRSAARTGRCRRSISSATSAAAACCWPSAWCAACWRRRSPARARWSMPR